MPVILPCISGCWLLVLACKWHSFWSVNSVHPLHPKASCSCSCSWSCVCCCSFTADNDLAAMQIWQHSCQPPPSLIFTILMSGFWLLPMPVSANTFHGAGHFAVGAGGGDGGDGGGDGGVGAGGPTPHCTSSSHQGSKWFPSGPGNAPPCLHCGHW